MNMTPSTAALLTILINMSCGCSSTRITAESITVPTVPHVVLLNWQPSPKAASYNIHRSPRIGGPYQKIGTSNTVTFLDRVSEPASFYYYVTAVNQQGESAPSIRLRVSIPAE